MNTIRFELLSITTDLPDVRVGIWIDGESLIDRICRLEASWWEQEGVPQPEGQYVWVPAREALLPARHLLGDPVIPYCFDDFSVVVICNCGFPECGAYAVRIEVFEDRVEWAAWREIPPEEARLGDALRPLRFERGQYIDELQRVSNDRERSNR